MSAPYLELEQKLRPLAEPLPPPRPGDGLAEHPEPGQTFADPTYVAVLTDHIWLIGNNDTKSPLYTSDNPLVSRGHYGGTGLATVGIEIAFPLTPKYVLLLYERTAFQHRLGQDCQTITLNPDRVNYSCPCGSGKKVQEVLHEEVVI